jgi:hypothetical protein
MLALQQTVQEQNIFVSKLALAFCTGKPLELCGTARENKREIKNFWVRYPALG